MRYIRKFKIAVLTVSILMVSVCYATAQQEHSTLVTDNKKGIGIYVSPKFFYRETVFTGLIGSLEVGVIHDQKYQYALAGTLYWGGHGSVESIDATVGKVIYDDGFRVFARAGLGYAHEGDSFFSKRVSTFKTISIPVKLQVSLPFKYVSFGVDLFANLNPKVPYFMPALSLEIGRLKW